MESEQKPITLCEKACGYFMQIQKKHMCSKLRHLIDHVLNEQGTGYEYQLNWKMGLSSERASKN